MSYVTSQQEGSILLMTLNRPEALNALNAQVLEDLDKALDGVDLKTVRCLVITGAGDRAFAAGADIAAMADMEPEEAAAFSRRGNAVFRRIESFPLPTIAAVNGYALGGGCELTLACDIRVAAENAKFALSEIKVGIIGAEGYASLMVPEKVLRYMAFSGNAVTAQQLHQWG
ncbi:MAG: enoyl-CoA hydratase/isomerase family protein, partial [Clostridia bacterium]|nr:enoyl-CoA hydratase/isomerase family protein [Clostridia bacterium]